MARGDKILSSSDSDMTAVPNPPAKPDGGSDFADSLPTKEKANSGDKVDLEDGTAAETSLPHSDAPDGGPAAWLVVLGGWCVLFCSFGWVNSALPTPNVPSCLPCAREREGGIERRLLTMSDEQASEPSRNTIRMTFSTPIPPVQFLGSPPYRFSSKWPW